MSKADDIVIFGDGGYARVAADAAEASGRWRVAAFLSVSPDISGNLMGRPIWNESRFLQSGGGPHMCLVAIGDNFAREKLVEHILAQRPGIGFATAIHPRAIISPHTTVGEGSVILAGAVVNPLASVGRHVALYSNAVVEHDCQLADFVTLAPGATLGGKVRLGTRSFLGLGAVVSHNCQVGADCVIGAQCTAIQDLPDRAVAVGTPARIVRLRHPGERYL